jgi:ankyrin repeat protein
MRHAGVACIGLLLPALFQACAAAAPSPPAPLARCPDVVATPGLDPLDPQSLMRWKGGPPLVHALGADRHDRLRKLLADGENPNVCLLGFSLLTLAVASGNVEEVRILLDAGAHPDLPRDSAGGTPLLGAIDAGHYEVARLLLQRGADVRIVADGNVTALYRLAISAVPLARQAEQVAFARTLIEAGASIDAAMGVPQVTPLMMAASRGNMPLVEALLAAAADPRLRDRSGRTAQDIALKKGHADVADLLTASAAPPK